VATVGRAGHAQARPALSPAQAQTGCGLTGNVSDHGTKQSARPTVALEAGDSFFTPTCVMGLRPGTVTVTVRSAGSALHNFSVPDQGIDLDLPRGSTVTARVRVGRAALPFFCKYHRTSGMVGALQGAASAVAARRPAKRVDLAPFALVAAMAVAIPVLFLAASATGPPAVAADEEIELVVAGIAQGSAGVPRWLYLVYVLVPAWAMFYLFTGVQRKTEPPAPVPSSPGAANPVSAPTTPAAKAGPINIVAKNIAFDVASIALPAGSDAQIVFRNDDQAIPHNVAIYRDSSTKDVLFKGDLITGPASKTYSFRAPPAGSYFFQCDVHPASMHGTVVSA
jgi:plastocyanin